VTLRLKDEIDLSRGDMLVAAQNLPQVSRAFRAMVVWMHSQPLEVGASYLVKHTARQTKIRATRIWHRVNVNTLAHEPAERLQMNEIAEVEFEANVPLFFDAYSRNRMTGSFILIDPLTNATLGAGMIAEAKAGQKSGSLDAEIAAISLDRASTSVALSERSERNGHHPAIVFAGSGSGIGAKLERALFDRGFAAVHVDTGGIAIEAIGDVVRVALTAGLVVIYSGDAGIATIRAERFFDVAALAGGDASTDERTIQAVLGFAETLLLKPAAGGGTKVN